MTTDHSPEPRDEELTRLLRRMGQGADDAAFEQLVCLGGAAVLHLLRRRVGQEHARDLAQETFLRVYKNRASFRGEASAKTWLLRIATNVASNHLREQQAAKRKALTVSLDEAFAGDDQRAPSVQEPKDSGDDPSVVALKKEDAHRLRQAIGDLPPQVRLSMQRVYLKGLSIRQVADRRGVSESTVKSQLQEGKRRLRSLLR